ncbi:hypothetical protein [Sedimentibacter sp. MB31-C6]|uniref:hypothetical protein n=1 Tax=Sedimentibacter sp. MB31-C6 TaxID=3109366 RepID=UPI002DDCF21B|nr:hypothetical protein [Sedimentibacter sp. MB36-C1]WSI04710.1 hypothetical protein U8307_02700 [Sedimentibacter sp. MB36-C1]
MARRRKRRVYSKKRKLNIIPLIVIVVLFILLLSLVMKIFQKDNYLTQIDDILNSDITMISGILSSASNIDTIIYEKEGIRYTNQHNDLNEINSFDGSLSEDLDKVGTTKLLLENVVKSEEYMLVSELPEKKDGYYWLDINIIVDDKFLIFKDEEEFNLDLYYDIAERNIYVKEKYYDEFNMKNNKLQLQGYKANEEFVNLIEDLAGRQ